jgi:hypothetical protein
MLSNGILCVSEPDTVVIPQAEPGEIPFCYCEYECDYIQLVLAGTDEYETDCTDFLADIPDPDGSFQVFMTTPDGQEIELTDDTYGTYFELGTMAQASKAGYLVDWGKVATEVSKYGLYTFRLVSNFFGTDIEKETHQYYLQPYSPTVADGTVRIETIRNGCIEGGVDYSGLNWKTQIRLKGKITGEREIETESYVNTSREEKQIQDKVINKYTLTTKGIQSIVFDDLMEDGFMANVIKLTDYTIFSYRNLRDVEVRIEEYTEQNEYWTTRNANFVIGFVELVQNKIKRN